MTRAILRLGPLTVVAILLGALPLATLAQSGGARQEGQQQSVAEPVMVEFTQMLVGDLTARGFQVSQGYAKLYIQQDCIDHTYPTLRNCFGANPAAPYVMPVVKSWPDEYVDPAVVNAFVETDPGYSATFRLDPGEAIVIYGQMPPPGRYMGLQTWEFSQHGKWRPKDYSQWAKTPDLPYEMQYLFDTIPPNFAKSQRVITFSALGDIINNVVMERKSGEYPFGQTRYFIITPSAKTDSTVRLALQAQGVPDSYIFTEQIPSSDEIGPIGPIGMGENAIDFVTAFRYAVADDPAAANEWRTKLPLRVLRVRAPASLGPLQRYKSLIFEPRTAISEDYLAGDLQDLVSAVCGDVTNHASLTSTDCVQPLPASSIMLDLVRDYGWVAPYCREIGLDCQGDQQDAAYYFSAPRSLDSGQVYAVVGTLATETGNATYVGMSANDASMMSGVANVLDTGLKDSADSYKGTVGNTGKLFVHYFARDCTVLNGVPGATANCTEISEAMLPPAGQTTAPGDPALHGMVVVGLRDYIAPGTERGPENTKLLRPIILTFTRS